MPASAEGSGGVTTPGPTPEKRALIDAYDSVMRADATRRASRTAGSMRRTRPVSWIVFTVLIAGVAGLAILRPDVLRPDTALHEPPELREASLRFAMGIQIERIAKYQRTHGNLPLTLPDAGPVLPGATYRPLPSGRYELDAVNGAASLTYTSDTPLRQFMGNAFDVIVKRNRP